MSFVVPRSIVGWFIVCWSAFLLAAVTVGVLLWSLYQESAVEQVRRASATVTLGCDMIADRYQFFIAGTSRTPADLRDPALAQGLADVVRLALRDLQGVEGGVWQAEAGSLAYAFPTYEGSGEKTDLPQAEQPSIKEAAEAAALDGSAVERRQEARSQVLLLRACPLPGPIPDLAGWTMTRVVTTDGRAYGLAMGGLSVLLVVLAGSATWLGYLLLGWSSRLKRLEGALARGAGDLPKLAPTGQRDLDRIVEAINGAGARLAEARQREESLARQVAQSERLAALGRVTAGVAHEIRNPIGAMRLKAENALAADTDPSRKESALRMILTQIGRLDTLLRNLLNSVQSSPPKPRPVSDIGDFLRERAEFFREQAAAQAIDIIVDTDMREAGCFDEEQVAQALGNLILNAIENTPAEGTVRLAAERHESSLVLSVADTGRGVPQALRANLFEPFATGRAEGTGLGLAIVREIIEAHKGTVRVMHRNDGTTFVVELPWRPS
ncbi:sensor histidine kinase [Mesorhizobium sp. RIZ17]|uniref:sensor histidine kinase n=1 Tax=Mesorhizobium sp. RIZ17 TaxID=3132743 RepID=UPI003DA8C226